MSSAQARYVLLEWLGWPRGSCAGVSEIEETGHHSSVSSFLQRDLREEALPFMQDLFEATPRQSIWPCSTALRSFDREDLRASALGGGLADRRAAPRPLHAVGKAIIAVSPPSVLDAVLAAGLARRTAFTITVPSVLRKQLARAPRTGVVFGTGGVRPRRDLCGAPCACSGAVRPGCGQWAGGTAGCSSKKRMNSALASGPWASV